MPKKVRSNKGAAVKSSKAKNIPTSHKIPHLGSIRQIMNTHAGDPTASVLFSDYVSDFVDCVGGKWVGVA